MSSRQAILRICLSFGWLVLTVAVLHPTSAAAHQMPYTAVMLDFGRDGVSAELILPVQELQLGFKQPLLEQPEQIIPKHASALKDYLLAHVRPTAPDGRPWTVEVSDMDVRLEEQPVDLVAHL